MLHRFVLMLFVLGSLTYVVNVEANDEAKPAAPAPTPSAAADDAALTQQILARRYKDFEQALLRLAQRLERSPRPEDRERAAVLKQAIEKAGASGIDNKFEKLITTLKTTKSASLQDIQEAMTQNKTLAEDIQTILAMLRSENREDLLKAEKKRLEELIKMIDKAIIDEKNVRAKTEGGKTDKESLAKDQNKITKYTEGIARAMNKDGKGGEGKSSENKEAKQAKGDEKKDGQGKEAKGDTKGDAKDNKNQKGEGKKDGQSKDGKGAEKKDGQNKEAKGEGKGEGKKDGKEGKGDGKKDGQGKEGKGEAKGEGKSEGEGKKSQDQGQAQGKPGQGQQGESKQGEPQKPNPQNPADNGPGKKQIQDAIEGQKRAEEEIKRDKKDDASKTQDEVVRNLEDARKKLEEILKQIREEEKERMLAALQARCERMLMLQIAVYEDTLRVHEDVGRNADKKPSRANEQKALDLSKREDQIVGEANKAITLLTSEGSAVAFPEVFIQVRDDMKIVSGRLLKADVAIVTQTIEQDIIASLKDMVEALKKAQQEMKNNKQPPPPGGQPPPNGVQPLIDMIAELKMIRAMQVRVNNRTTTYAREYEGEQVPQPSAGKIEVDKVEMIQKELKNLSERQQKIYEVVKNIAAGKNR